MLDQLTPGSTNFVIKAVMPNPGLVFRSGMVVTGRVSRPVTAGVRVPVTAFVDDTQTTVQTIVDGAVKTVPVTMIAEDDKNAIVRGIRPGLTIISNGQLGLADGQQVAPLKGSPGGPGGRPKTVAER